MKICSKCQETKELSKFSIQRLGKDGRRADCMVCKSAADKARYVENREALLAQSKAYNAKHREKCIEYGRNYRLQHPEKTKERNDEAYAKNRDDRMEYARTYNKRYPQKVKARNALSYAVKTGVLPPPTVCEMLDCDSTHHVDYHHDSYAEDKRLDVRPLCRSHHLRWHAENTPECSEPQ